MEIFLTLQTESKGRVLTFDTSEQFIDFLNNEMNNWAWLGTPQLSSVPGNPFNQISSHWAQVLNSTQGYLSQPAGYQEAINQIVKQYIIDTNIPISGSPYYISIEGLREKNEVEAGYGIAILMNQLQAGTNFKYFLAAFEIAAHEAGINIKSAKTLKNQLNESLAKQQSEFENLKRDTKLQRQLFSEAKKKAAKSLLRLARVQNDNLRKQKEQIDLDFATSKSNIDATQSAYMEFMRLKAPVEYWSKKAIMHTGRATLYRNILGGFAILGGGILIYGLYQLSNHALSVVKIDTPPAVVVILATLGVVCTTVIFWIARVLTRLFLSEHHLGIDSEERSVMISTYLALTAEGKVTESERVLVLSSVFRPSSDGIVRDDGAPDLSPASLLAKAMLPRSV